MSAARLTFLAKGVIFSMGIWLVVPLMLMAATNELISLFISLELVNLSMYSLVGFLKNDRSTEAALKYLLLSGVASAVLLFGTIFILANPDYLNTTTSFFSRLFETLGEWLRDWVPTGPGNGQSPFVPAT